MSNNQLIPKNNGTIDIDELLNMDEAKLKIVASRKDTNPDILSILASCNSSDVLNALAANPNTPPEILTLLAERNSDLTSTEYYSIVESVASNSSTLPVTLEKIVVSKITDEATALALQNPNVTLMTLINYLINNQNKNEVRLSTASNPKFLELMKIAQARDDEQSGKLNPSKL